MSVMSIHITRTEGYDEIPQHSLERLRPLRENYHLRMNTFADWSKPNVCASTLCENGFYYMGISDKVQCAYCGGVLSGWSVKDDVGTQHARHYGHCELVQKRRKLHNSYDSYNNRLASFDCWPIQLHQTPNELAVAGLYYTGIGDKCKCYMCGGILSEWEPTDDPKKEHNKWFPDCCLSTQEE